LTTASNYTRRSAIVFRSKFIENSKVLKMVSTRELGQLSPTPFVATKIMAIAVVLFCSGIAIAGKNEDLITAARNRDTAKVKELLANGADVNARDTYGWTALMHASNLSYPEIVRVLLAKGADVNARGKRGKTPLMGVSAASCQMIAHNKNLDDSGDAVCMEGEREILQELLAKGADIHARDKNGKTALMYASGMGYHEIVRDLLVKGAEVNAKDKQGRTALIEASQWDYVEAVRELLSKGADVNVKEKDGGTALMAACFGPFYQSKGSPEIVRELLAKGADVNARDDYGMTALMVASEKSYPEIVRELLAKGADVNAKDNGGQTALMRAIKAGQRELADLLIKAGATK